MPGKTDKKNIINNISAIIPTYCDRCGAKHDPADLEVVSNNGKRAMCKLGCKNCGNNYMISVNSPVQGMLAAKRAPFKSEITSKEISKFSGPEVQNIQSNEIIDVYTELESITTIEEFNKLF